MDLGLTAEGTTQQAFLWYGIDFVPLVRAVVMLSVMQKQSSYTRECMHTYIQSILAPTV